MENWGDERYFGNPCKHSETLSTYLTPTHATGRLQTERLCLTARKHRDNRGLYDSDDEMADDSDEEIEDDVSTLQKHLVLKVKLEKGRCKPRIIGLTRLDVMKQMFDAFVNRILAYDHKTHMGLVVFETSAKVS